MGSLKNGLRILLAEKYIGIIKIKHLNLEKRQYLPHYWSVKYFKGTVVNREMPSLHGGSLEITLSVPLMSLKSSLNIDLSSGFIMFHRFKQFQYM